MVSRMSEAWKGNSLRAFPSAHSLQVYSAPLSYSILIHPSQTFLRFISVRVHWVLIQALPVAHASAATVCLPAVSTSLAFELEWSTFFDAVDFVEKIPSALFLPGFRAAISRDLDCSLSSIVRVSVKDVD